MAQFTNYNKRSFMLPLGCNDLIDVLRSRRATMQLAAHPSILPLDFKEDRFPEAGAAHIVRYVTMLLQSQGAMFTLSLSSERFEFPVTMYSCRSAQTAAIVLVTKEAHREQAIRAFFERQGIEVLWDYPPSVLGADDSALGLAYPLPSEAARATELTNGLLRSVYGLSDEVGVDFIYYEMV